MQFTFEGPAGLPSENGAIVCWRRGEAERPAFTWSGHEWIGSDGSVLPTAMLADRFEWWERVVE